MDFAEVIIIKLCQIYEDIKHFRILMKYLFRFENVSMLLDTVEDLITQTGYFWVDPHGAVTRQNGVFRINCVDCLDRTNVVQVSS